MPIGTPLVASSSNSASTTSISAAIPAGASVGDLCIVFACAERGITPTFTGVSFPNTVLAVADGTLMAVNVAWKILASGEPGTTVNATVGTGRRMAMGIITIPGADNLNFTLSSATTSTAQPGGTTSVTTPNVTPPEADCMLLGVLLAIKEGTPFTFSGTVPGPWTERIDVGSTSGSSANAFVYVASNQLTGGSGVSQSGPTVTQTQNVRLFHMTIAVQPGSANASPTCDAGADQTNIEAYTTVTVTGSDADSDGTVTTRTWRVISTTNGAASPTLNGSGNARTFKAPGAIAGTIVTLGYQVTDNLGATSTEDTCTVAVLPVTERAVVGGVEVPLEVQAITP